MTDDAKNVLIKLSGDLYLNPKIIEDLYKISSTSEATLICGFGTEYGKTLNAANIQFHYENGIRIIDNPEEEQRALRIGHHIQNEIQAKLRKEIPRIKGFLDCISTDKDGKLVNINGDELVRKHGAGYDEVIVYTLKGREKYALSETRNVTIVYY